MRSSRYAMDPIVGCVRPFADGHLARLKFTQVNKIEKFKKGIMFMQKIGNLEFLNSRTLIIPPGDDAWITVDVMGWSMRLHLIFNQDATESSIEISPHDGHAKMKFNAWASTLGTSMLKPLELAKHSNGRKIFFIAACYSIGESSKNSTLKIDLQFMMETEK